MSFLVSNLLRCHANCSLVRQQFYSAFYFTQRR